MSASAGVVETDVCESSTSTEVPTSFRVVSAGTGSTTSAGTASTSSTGAVSTSSSSSSTNESDASELFNDDGYVAPDVYVMFSGETREHVLGLLEEGYPASDVADIIGCSERSMRRWMQHYERNGTVWCRGCHGYIPEEYIHALYPYPLRIRAGDAYSKCIMRKRGEDISILYDKELQDYIRSVFPI